MKKVFLVLMIAFAGTAYAETINFTDVDVQSITQGAEESGSCADYLPDNASCMELRCGRNCWWNDSSGQQHVCHEIGC